MAFKYNKVVGAGGRSYLFQHMIQERSDNSGCVWLAKSGPEKFLLKEVSQSTNTGFHGDILPRLRKLPYVRIPLETIQEEGILIYEYLDGDFLDLVEKQIPMQARRQILKASLRGLADLHDHDIVHLDIKPDNIMVNYRQSGPETKIDRVQIIDLENAACLPQGKCIRGMLAGNENWRSPEAHFRGDLFRPTDIFSFAVVCIYAVLGRVIFGPDDDFRKHVAQEIYPFLIRLQRQISYFGDRDGVNGLMNRLGEDEASCILLRMLWDERGDERIPYRPFSEWPDVQDDFKDLISGMTHLDPKKRITARQALEHPWFRDIDVSSIL